MCQELGYLLILYNYDLPTLYNYYEIHVYGSKLIISIESYVAL